METLFLFGSEPVNALNGSAFSSKHVRISHYSGSEVQIKARSVQTEMRMVQIDS